MDFFRLIYPHSAVIPSRVVFLWGHKWGKRSDFHNKKFWLINDINRNDEGENT